MFSKRFRILQIHLGACITKIKHFAIIVFTFLISSMSVLTPRPHREIVYYCVCFFSFYCYTKINILVAMRVHFVPSFAIPNCYDHHFQLFILSIKRNVEKLPYFHSINFWILQNGTKWSSDQLLYAGSWKLYVFGLLWKTRENMRDGSRWEVLEGVIRSTWANYANAVVALLSHVIILYIAPLYVNNIYTSYPQI